MRKLLLIGTMGALLALLVSACGGSSGGGGSISVAKEGEGETDRRQRTLRTRTGGRRQPHLRPPARNHHPEPARNQERQRGHLRRRNALLGPRPQRPRRVRQSRPGAGRKMGRLQRRHDLHLHPQTGDQILRRLADHGGRHRLEHGTVRRSGNQRLAAVAGRRHQEDHRPGQIDGGDRTRIPGRRLPLQHRGLPGVRRAESEGRSGRRRLLEAPGLERPVRGEGIRQRLAHHVRKKPLLLRKGQALPADDAVELRPQLEHPGARTQIGPGATSPTASRSTRSNRCRANRTWRSRRWNSRRRRC